MNAYDQLQIELKAAPQTWLVTGVAGFIGSNLLEALLKLNQRVVGLDNFRDRQAEEPGASQRRSWRRRNGRGFAFWKAILLIWPCASAPAAER